MKPLLPLLVFTAVGMAIYHLGQKLQPSQANPMVLLAGVYAVALVLSLAALPFFRTPGEPPLATQLLRWPVLVVGVGVLLIELGFLLVYRTGGGLAWVGVAVNALCALLLIPVALVFFREHLTAPRLLGVFLSLAGLVLMAWRK